MIQRQIHMRVTHVNLGKALRGGERQMLALIDALRGRVDQILIVRRKSRLHDAVADRNDIEVVATPASSLLAAIQLRGTDVAHIHDAHSVRTGALACLLFGVPYVITRRVPHMPRGFFLTRYSYLHAGKITTVSRTVQATMHEYDANLPLQTVYECLPPLQPDFSGVAELRASAGGKLIVGHVAELDDAHKGQRLLLRAARRIANSHPQVVFWLIGRGQDEQALRIEAGDLPNVVFCGWTDRIADYYAAMDVFVYPSRFEALGSGILEAMSLGLPVLAACVGGIPEIVHHAKNGLLFRAGDVADFTTQLTRLLDNPPLRRNLGRAAIASARAFTAKDAPERFCEIYSQLNRCNARRCHSHADLRY